MSLVKKISNRIRNVFREERRSTHVPAPAHDWREPYYGRRATSEKVMNGGGPAIRKRFAPSKEGEQCLSNELLAHELFSGKKWMPPLLAHTACCVTRPYYPENRRLDQVAFKLSRAERLSVAKKISEAMFDIFMCGYAHRDLHGKNIFWFDGEIKLVDFETLAAYGEKRPAFPLSYDITGSGLPSPFDTGHMSYLNMQHPSALQRLLRVKPEVLFENLVGAIKQSLREASADFKTARDNRERHTCAAKRIYNSISLPFLSVKPAEAQRDCKKRFSSFLLSEEDIRGKTILDLGCNIGGMIFESIRLSPRSALGIEYDSKKVDAARCVAAYNGLSNIIFRQANIDELTFSTNAASKFDVTFCLAVEAHVKDRARLFRTLRAATKKLLIFEGNGATQPAQLVNELRAVGFVNIQTLGNCNDDCCKSNNTRPLFRAEASGK